jgi:NADH:ubiquinone oxidoreductase subunit 4 (subunit M)
MFFLVDCVQKRYQTRIVSEISGILHTTPNLGISILLMQILYSGLPGTLKFLSEFYIFSGLIGSAPFSAVIIMYVANFLGLIGFSKC